MKQFLFALATALTLSLAQQRTITITPGENITSIVNAAPENSTVQIQAGRYFISEPLRPRANVTIEGVGSVVIHGSRLLENWVRWDNPTRYEVGGQRQQGFRYTNPDWQVCESAYPRCNYPDDVYFNDTPLRHVATLADLAEPPGTPQVNGEFYFNYDTDTIAIDIDPQNAVISAAVTPYAVSTSAAGVIIRNVQFERFASPTERAALELNGTGALVENVTIRLSHGNGIIIRDGGAVRNARLIDNGQSGGGAAGVGGLYEGNEIARNNYAGHAVSFSAGGLSKGANTTSLTVRNNRVFDNRGEGIWLDSYNRNALIEGNTVYGNTRSGIFYELSYGGTVIRNNSVRCNGGYGQINNTSSAGTADDPILITGNTITVCAGSKGEALTIRSDGRRPTDYITVQGNTFRFEETRGKVILDAWNGGALGANIAFTGNVFYVLNDGRYWRWDGTDRAWPEWAARYPGDTRIVGLPIPTKEATPSSTPNPTLTPTPSPSRTITLTVVSTPSVTVEPTVGATVTPGMETQTPTPQWVQVGVYRITIMVEQLVTPD